MAHHISGSDEFEPLGVEKVLGYFEKVLSSRLDVEVCFGVLIQQRQERAPGVQVVREADHPKELPSVKQQGLATPVTAGLF